MMFRYLSDILICGKKHVSFEIVVCFIHLVTREGLSRVKDAIRGFFYCNSSGVDKTATSKKFSLERNLQLVINGLP